MTKEIYSDLTYGQLRKVLDQAIKRKDVKAAWCSAGWQKEDGIIRYSVTVELKEEDEKAQ